MKAKVVLFFIGVLFSSCGLLNERHGEQKEGTEISEAFLSSHEWMVDSIYGSEEFIQDWIYFTPQNEFYRFSKFNESYVLDSALSWNGSKILNDGKQVYTISALDSQNIELIAGNTVYHAKRWSKFDNEYISMFIKNNKLKLLINGKWRLDSIELKATTMPSFCEELYAGAVFDFTNKGRLDVFPSGTGNNCNTYSYQIYNNEVSLQESDMLLDFPIELLTNSLMVLKSKYIPINVYVDEESEVYRKGYNLYFSKL